jgi:trans-resveratrol di-O-methyltransferase
VESLVDVGGGDDQTMARAIAAAFPNIWCSVLELPHIVDGAKSATAAGGGGSGSNVEFVAGDMMGFIPPADALLLKVRSCTRTSCTALNYFRLIFFAIFCLQFILRDWGDEDCVRILKRCRDAVSAREPKGKLVIIDTVVGSTSNETSMEAQLLIDLSMMMLLTAKERDEEQWSRLFMGYKISPVLGFRSLIEVYPQCSHGTRSAL